MRIWLTGSVDFLDFVAVGVERLDDLLDVLLVVRLDRDRQHDLLEAVGDLRLVVVELDDIGILFGKDARDVEQLARLVRQLDGEAEDTAACNQGLVDERRDGRDVDVAARDDGDDLLALEGELCERGEREDAGAFRDELVMKTATVRKK